MESGIARKIICAMIALLIEAFVVLAFVQPLFTVVPIDGYTNYGNVVNRYLVNILGGGDITTGYGLADALPGLLLAALMALPPALLVSKKGNPVFYLGIGLSFGAIAIGLYTRAYVSDYIDTYLQSNTRYAIEDGFAMASLVVYSALLILFIILRFVDALASPLLEKLVANKSPKNAEERLREARSLREQGAISEEEYSILKKEILKDLNK